MTYGMLDLLSLVQLVAACSPHPALPDSLSLWERGGVRVVCRAVNYANLL
jgi:hypothetical protein